ncbi:IclR family transcriptional regulator [Rhodococcus sp. BP-252]|uniref:Glycerol operon regulatory protein n=1 Tax=Rhodococcoides kyotonense TaxID=398843 RepID=A0A177Y8B7_9NOCA|nr:MULTISPECIES: IclR family transcriptional regulator [Rhodococcus]MBY6414642.1 IclR family transcriptional regulator [Rhodococcus sp. BP-320]MBY6419399.1 IclR family transcriptional regulator [Rhodococcus sp. BP-321]MBY6424445.1 IclR family transcriptional regulator [Rhodococcus sp. BP-324]MBY6429478.1 IclR family transcriptional regulator [Rhodococcus sp. BP-323]MBY6434454.1 IclR family transcriptional regulator [Rhodococcus sp. BP-322]
MPAIPELEIDPKNHIASVVKATRILEAFDRESPELSINELVKRCGYTRTTTHRVLATLELTGWLERTSTGDYKMTLRVFELASSVLGSFDLRTEASHVMSDLAARFDENVYLVVPDGTRAVCLDLIESSRPVRVMSLSVGRSLPLFIGGAPVALLAELEDTLLPRLLSSGPLTTPLGQDVDEPTLRRILADTRARGYAISLEDVTPGVAALGACIFDRARRPVAALSFGGFLSNFEQPRRTELAEALVDGALTISRRLGFQDRA